MSVKKPQKERKIFLNCMNSWLSNFIIEELRTDYLPEAKIQNIFMGTIDLTGGPIPALFEPKETTVEIGYNYNQEVFDNDIFIYNLDDSNLSEVEFILRGLQTIKYNNEKIIILISNIMTWANTPIKTFSDEERNKEGFNEEEVPEFEEEKTEEKEEKIEEKEENIEEDKKSETSKVSKETIKSKNKDKNIKENKNKSQLKKDINKKEEENINELMKDKEKENISDIKLDEQNMDNKSNPKESLGEQIEKKEKPKIKTYYYKESEYEKRIPNSKYFYYKILESLALSNNNPNLKAYVICPGFIYGCGEDIFFDYFRAAWLNNIDYLPIIGDGLNHIPTIHVLDLVQVIKRVINLKPDINYIFAFDRTKNPTFKNIIRTISKGIGGIDIKLMNDFNINEINLPHYTEFNIDVRIKLSSIMEDEPRRNKEDLEDYNERKFPWHCEFGIPENINILRDEFNLYRDLKSSKIIILGPPYCGKSTIAKIISEKYKLSHLTIDKICDWAKNEDTPLGEEVRQKSEEMEENISKAMEEYEHRKNKKKTDPPFDPTQFRKFQNDFLGKIMKAKLSNGECVGKGYILENYPKNYEDCINAFSNTPYDKEKKEEEIKYEINKDLLPDSVIVINNYSVDSLKNKLKLKFPDYAERQNELDAKFNRRLSNYKHFEEINDDNKKLIVDFFKENNVDIYFIDEGKLIENNNLEEENKKMFEFLERNGSIDNEYKLYDEEEIKIFETINNKINKEENKNEEENKNSQEKEEEEEENKDKINSQKDENEKEINDEEKINSKENNEDSKKSNINETDNEKNNEEKKMSNIGATKIDENEKIQKKLNEIKEREIILLEKKSEILRRYLSENIMPLLAKGVFNICQNMPDDPVEALANFLLEHSLNISNDNEIINKTENELVKMIDQTIN